MDNVLAIQTASQRLTIDPAIQSWTLYDIPAKQRLLFGGALHFDNPIFHGIAPANTELVQANQRDDRTIVLSFRRDGLAEHDVIFHADADADAIDVTGHCIVESPCQLNRLELFPVETSLNLYDVVNFRNRHLTPRTWPELLLGGEGCSTDTYSTDWQFAPHPTVLLIRKAMRALCVGSMDLAPTYGMYFKARDYRLQHWYLDYGAAPHGLPLQRGQRLQFPRLRLFLRTAADPHDLYRQWGRMLISAAKIADPARKRRDSWWLEPLYCTWMDQNFSVSALPPAELAEQTTLAISSASSVLNEKFVRDAVQVIRRERLSIRTILLDAGWQMATGQWQPHPDRFPQFRTLIDELHQQGFKVVVWWNWAELESTADAVPAHLIAGGKLNRHGQRMRDYSLPATQEEYLKPLLRKLFSPEADCYDLDGVKTDFLADKVHPDMPPADPGWRGEENYFLRVTQLFYQTMKHYKPDAMHLGCAGNYWLAEYIDLNRTYDVHSSDWREHENRARMLLATTPGCPASYDFHNFIENHENWLASAQKLGAAVEIGNVLYVCDDLFAKPRHADAAYYQTLRAALKPRPETLREIQAPVS